MIQGEEWLIEGFGCRAASLRDMNLMQALCERVIKELALSVVGEPQWRQFPGPGGVTGLYLLSESHLTCHSWPEHGTIAFNLFTCKDRERWDWEQALAAALSAEHVSVRRVRRGIRFAAEGNGSAPAEVAFQDGDSGSPPSVDRIIAGPHSSPEQRSART